MKIGQSTDIHRLTKDRPLILGGVKIDHYLGLAGHSDADVLCHVVAEAIIGALGLGDLGNHFPDNDGKYKNISSLMLLNYVKEMMQKHNYVIGNIDALIMIEKPKLANYIKKMKENIANTLSCLASEVNIKATTGEGIGFIGKEEGVVATAVVLLKKKDYE